jgi:hypothetical protein
VFGVSGTVDSGPISKLLSEAVARCKLGCYHYALEVAADPILTYNLLGFAYAEMIDVMEAQQSPDTPMPVYLPEKLQPTTLAVWGNFGGGTPHAAVRIVEAAKADDRIACVVEAGLTRLDLLVQGIPASRRYALHPLTGPPIRFPDGKPPPPATGMGRKVDRS